MLAAEATEAEHPGSAKAAAEVDSSAAEAKKESEGKIREFVSSLEMKKEWRMEKEGEEEEEEEVVEEEEEEKENRE